MVFNLSLDEAVVGVDVVETVFATATDGMVVLVVEGGVVVGGGGGSGVGSKRPSRLVP